MFYCRFPLNQWFGAQALDKKTRILVKLNEEIDFRPTTTFIVQTMTGSKHFPIESHSPSVVYLDIFFRNADSFIGPIFLNKSTTNVEPFRRNQIDEFHLDDLPSFGEIIQIRLSHAGTSNLSWHCEWFVLLFFLSK